MAETNQGDGGPKREMLKYRDGKGNVIEFPKPKEPNILDLLDQERWGFDKVPIVIPEDELKLDDEPESEPESEMPKKPLSELTEEEMLEAARRKQRQVEKREERRKIKRATRKGEVILERMKYEKFDLWNFPRDPDNWTEKDLGEEWADRPIGARGSGYDPDEKVVYPDEDTAAVIRRRRETERQVDQQLDKIIKQAREKVKKRAQDPSLPESESEDEDDGKFHPRPYYVPYRKNYPLIPRVHPEVSGPEDVIDELEKIEEFLQWGSYIFADGSKYEGTLWDDQAHGRGVYHTPMKLCRYEGEWFQNMMQGHGVMEVDVPVNQPAPDSELEKEMREQGYIIKADYMDPEDREFLKKDIEDLQETPGVIATEPQYEDDPLWIEEFGELPEKGRYKYAGQWKHNRMHGCGVYEVNTRPVWGKFYFGEYLLDRGECSFEKCLFHAGMAEVAAGKAKMFAKKPDGMVKQREGPYTDPVHPYMYEEDELWMAPGWINAYYEVPDMWKVYVQEVDKEQQMWLNGYIKSPLRLPMPSELEYSWHKGREFMFLKPPEGVPNPDDCLLLHIPSRRLINWIYDDEGRKKMFWQPYKEEGSVNPEEIVFLEEGWDEFFSDNKEEPEKDIEAEFEELMAKKEAELDEELRKLNEEAAEIKAKWKEEDEELKEELRLIGVAIEEERLAAVEYKKRQKEREEEAAKRAAENVEAAVEEAPPAEEEAEAEVKEEEAEEDEKKPSFGKVEDEQEEEDRKPSFGKVENVEEEEENEDDKKPRSFGTVAKAATGAFPTAWASITMSLSALKLGYRGEKNGGVERVESLKPAAPVPVYVSIGFARKKQGLRLTATALENGFSRGATTVRIKAASRFDSCRSSGAFLANGEMEGGESSEFHLLSLAWPLS